MHWLCLESVPPQIWKLHDRTNMEVELWVLKKWTQIHPSTRPTQVEAEMDSLGVMNLVKENPDPQGNLIEECKSMLE
ncbi:hypothetical protein RHMOL_Rhmol05G0171800 [Rhododendron molle]|uniref:Uncharacterized protein n=1 Tax=Rhododendron molle TaxID=49168 RepID=A0ACC0NRG7_RHOML|nr:hypothetical protein RHMOL_Rhmol05G0171800 [Rhododendron molle]